MHRFFVTEEQIDDEIVAINGQDAKHIRDVIRLKSGDQVEIVTENNVLKCLLEEVSRERVLARIMSKMEKLNEPPIKISLFQGLPKSVKMETILQKCTEVGVSEFYPVATERSVVKIKDVTKEAKKLDRWRSIIEEAAKQSRRDNIPKLGKIISFKEMLRFLEGKNVLVPYELEEEKTLRAFVEAVRGIDEVCIVIGPEGGFDLDEIQLLKNIGACSVTLGRRILRTETAGMVVASILLYELGDLGVIR